jgi:hypothetical protein
VNFGREHFGSEIGGRDPDVSYASWSTEMTDIYLQRVEGPGHDILRIVYRVRQRKDAIEL